MVLHNGENGLNPSLNSKQFVFYSKILKVSGLNLMIAMFQLFVMVKPIAQFDVSRSQRLSLKGS